MDDDVLKLHDEGGVGGETERKSAISPSSHGAQDSMMPSLADLRMDSGRGMECLTMAPYRPYSAITVLRPQHFSLFRHLALRFWNQTCDRIQVLDSRFLHSVCVCTLTTRDEHVSHVETDQTSNVTSQPLVVLSQ